MQTVFDTSLQQNQGVGHSLTRSLCHFPPVYLTGQHKHRGSGGAGKEL